MRVLKINKSKPLKTTFIFVIFTFIAISIIGFSNISYLAQAISGHFRIMNSREPIEKILNINEYSLEFQNKLKMILEVREFASKELGLPENKSYTVLSKVKGNYLGWNVYCAPKFSVEPKKWCFPIAGCVVYHGYFSKKKAVEFASKMEKKGFDVFVGPFNAYSSLGWYDDPILSTNLFLDSVQLAGIVIHELAHQKLYLKGDSRFNEGFAVTVERAGVIKWLKSIGKEEQITQTLKMWEDKDKMVAKILDARSQLNAVYSSDMNSKTLSEKKDSIFIALKEYINDCNHSGIHLLKKENKDFVPNNAYLVPIEIYYSLVPKFQRILDSCGGNLNSFYREAEKLGKRK